MTSTLLQSSNQCSISPVTTSDHRPVILHLRGIIPTTQGRGLPVVRSTFSSNPSLVLRFRAYLEDSINKAPLSPLALIAWWPSFKSNIAQFVTCLNQVASVANSRRPSITVAKVTLSSALANLEKADDPTGLLNPVLLARRAYMSALGPLTRRADRSARHDWIASGERPSPLLTKLTRPPPSVRVVPAIRALSGGLLTDGPYMASAVSRFWAGLSSSQARDPIAESAILESVTLHATPLPPSLATDVGSSIPSVKAMRPRKISRIGWYSFRILVSTCQPICPPPCYPLHSHRLNWCTT